MNQITNNQVCSLQYPHPIYEPTQESKENGNEPRMIRGKWNLSELTKDFAHKWTLAF